MVWKWWLQLKNSYCVMYYNFQHTFIPYKWTAANPSDAPLPVLRELVGISGTGISWTGWCPFFRHYMWYVYVDSYGVENFDMQDFRDSQEAVVCMCQWFFWCIGWCHSILCSSQVKMSFSLNRLYTVMVYYRKNSLIISHCSSGRSYLISVSYLIILLKL